MKLKQESKLIVGAVLFVYLMANVIKLLLMPEQSWQWHFTTSAFGLLIVMFFAFMIRWIDIYLDKRIPFEKNIVKRIALQFLITLSAIMVVRLMGYLVLSNFMHLNVSKDLWIASFVINIFSVLSIILFIFGFHFFKLWKEEKVLAAELEKEKAIVQYDNLKNQLNPHFLFNSLTSLDSLIFENPKLASEFLQQLSKVYRYVLENKNKNLVEVSTEVKFVTHYTHLLKSRFEKGLEVTFEIGEEAKERLILPVTLQILIENAIKHNSTSKDAPLYIQIANDSEYLIVSNNLQRKKNIETSNGQGLENLKNLYRYLTEREIVIEETEANFAVKIPLIQES
jgi:hypothetical protein